MPMDHALCNGNGIGNVHGSGPFDKPTGLDHLTTKSGEKIPAPRLKKIN
jgi:hypothetical protein